MGGGTEGGREGPVSGAPYNIIVALIKTNEAPSRFLGIKGLFKIEPRTERKSHIHI